MMDASLDTAYAWVVANVPYTSRVLFPSLVALTSFHLNCWLFTAYDAFVRARPKREIGTMLWECALPQTLAHAFFNTISFYHFQDTVVLPEHAPSARDFVLGLLACYVVGDFLIYWEHVFMHKIPFLRHYIHSTHHRFTSPLYSFNAGWVHPVEILVAAMCELAFPLAAGIHPLTLWVFLYTWVFWLVEEHSGSHVWWSMYEIMPGIGGGSRPHDVHHNPFLTKNYAFVFSIWDHLFGTFAEPPPFSSSSSSTSSQQRRKQV